MMDALTEAEVESISLLQRREAMERLTGHFTWPEFGDERRPSILRQVHQNFVYDVAQFTWTRGFAWSDVICTTTMAKDIFPQLNGVDIARQLNLLAEALAQRLPNLTPLQRGQLGWYLADTCIRSHRLLVAVTSPAASTHVTTLQGHLNVQVPPTPLPLAQGVTLEDVELQRQQRVELTAAMGCTEQQTLSDAPEVNVSRLLEMEGVQQWVRVAARHVTAGLHQDAALFAQVLEPKLQFAAAAARGGRGSAASARRPTAKQTRQAAQGKGKK